MTDTLLVRLKPYDPRRGHVLRRYTYAGIKFQEERGWYRVERPVAEYLRAVREVPSDRYAPLAFDVCTEAEAKAQEAGNDRGNKLFTASEAEAFASDLLASAGISDDASRRLVSSCR